MAPRIRLEGPVLRTKDLRVPNTPKNKNPPTSLVHQRASTVIAGKPSKLMEKYLWRGLGGSWRDVHEDRKFTSFTLGTPSTEAQRNKYVQISWYISYAQFVGFEERVHGLTLDWGTSFTKPRLWPLAVNGRKNFLKAGDFQARIVTTAMIMAREPSVTPTAIPTVLRLLCSFGEIVGESAKSPKKSAVKDGSYQRFDQRPESRPQSAMTKFQVTFNALSLSISQAPVSDLGSTVYAPSKRKVFKSSNESDTGSSRELSCIETASTVLLVVKEVSVAIFAVTHTKCPSVREL